MTVKAQSSEAIKVVMNDQGQPKEILIDGIIHSWTKNNSRDFRNAFNQLAEGGKDVTIRIGVCGGGSMFEGFAMTSMMRKASNKVITICESLAGSMAGVIFMAGDERHMSSTAMFMSHSPKVSCEGSAEDLRSTAGLMDKLQSNVIDLFTQQTGKSKDVVAKWFKREDTWMDADECIANGIATVKYGNGKSAPQDVLDALSEGSEAVYQVYNQIKTSNSPNNSSKNSMDKLKQFLITMALVFGLSQDANEEDVLNAAKKMAGDNNDLNNKLKGFQDAQNAERTRVAQELTNKLVESGKLPEHLKAIQMKAFTEDFDGTKQTVEALLKPEGKENDKPPKGGGLPESVASYLSGLQGQGKPAALKDKKFEDLTVEEKIKLEKEDPEAFTKLVDAYDGRKLA